MLQRFWSWLCFGDRRKRKDPNYAQLDDINTINSRKYKNPNEVQAYHIQTEKAFTCRKVHKNCYSSSHYKLVDILNKYKNENLDKYTRDQAKTVMKKAYPILEKIFLKESIQKFYTSWLSIFYALTAKNSQFNDLFKDLLDESWKKSDQSKDQKDAYVFIFLVAQDSILTRRLLKKQLLCYEEFVEEMKVIHKEIISGAILNS